MIKRKIVSKDIELNTFAVLDMGTSSIRMDIAQKSGNGQAEIIESLYQSISLGKDTFSKGTISTETTEQCIKTLRNFAAKLKMYEIEPDNHQRFFAFATNAVREASNRQQFLDRLFIGTGISVYILDEAEATGYLYLAGEHIINKHPALANRLLLIIEVGGGSSEFLLVDKGRVLFSAAYRIGSLRIQQQIVNAPDPVKTARLLFKQHIERNLQEILKAIPKKRSLNMLAFGGDARFAGKEIYPDWDLSTVLKLSPQNFIKAAEKALALTPDNLVKKYNISFPDAETLGPALLAYGEIASKTKIKNIYVSRESFREGILNEMIQHEFQATSFYQQMIHSSINLGRKFLFDEGHALTVSRLASSLFSQLQDEHNLPGRYKRILNIASLLHDTGRFISERSHHKHSMYIINNSEIFGLGKNDRALAALVARYHRKASPKQNHEGYIDLDRKNRIIVCKLSAILRTADALDVTHSGRIKKINTAIDDNTIIIKTGKTPDISLEEGALKRKGELFNQVFGKSIILRATND